MSAPIAPPSVKRDSDSSSNSSEEEVKSHHEILKSSKEQNKTQYTVASDPNVPFSQIVDRVDRLYGHSEVRICL